MPTNSGNWSGDSRYSLRLEMWLNSQDVATNSSNIGWAVYVDKNYSGGGISSGSGYTRTVTLSGDWSGVLDWSGPYNFSTTSSLYIGGSSFNTTHLSDGTRTFGAGINGVDSATLGTAYAGIAYVLPPIPRASVPTLSAGAVDAGSAVTITTNRADPTFTHDITYSFGALTNQTTGLALSTGVGASTTFTPPLAMLSQIPNAVSGTCAITVVTKNSGGTVLGSKTVNLTVAAPSSVVPTIGSLSIAEATTTPNIATIVGAYVQNLSRLDIDINSAAGAYGSTIVSHRITVAGQTINAASGVTPNPIGTSGTVTVNAEVTDSRGRISAFTGSNITVLAYSVPQITAIAIQRSNVGGVVDNSAGTYIRVDMTAAVQSLINVTQKNELHYRVFTSPSGTNTWTQRGTEVDVNALTFASNFVVTAGAPYAVTSSFDVRVEVVDELGILTTVQRSISTGAVLLDLNANLGVGVGKYHQNGTLDVQGDTYTTGAFYANSINVRRAATDTLDGVIELATPAEVITGTDTTRAVTTAGLVGRTATGARTGLVELATNAEAVTGTDTARAVTPANLANVLTTRAVPYRTAAGTTTTASGGTAITFPSGRFSVAPIVTVMSRHGSNVTVPYVVSTSITSTGFTVIVYTIGGAAVAGIIDWVAVQMTSSTAGG